MRRLVILIMYLLIHSAVVNSKFPRSKKSYLVILTAS